MVREGLLYGIRTAVHEARKLGESVRREGLRVRTNGGMTAVTVEVVPMRGVPGERHFLVLFEEETSAHGDHHPGKIEKPSRASENSKKRNGKNEKRNDRVRALEKETKRRLTPQKRGPKKKTDTCDRQETFSFDA